MPVSRRIADATPTRVVTPETYLGYVRLDVNRYRGTAIRPRTSAAYRFPATTGPDELSYGGRWTIGDDRAVAGPGARLRLRYHANHVYLVLGGQGRLRVVVDGRLRRTVRVHGDRLYSLVSSPAVPGGLLELRFDSGVNAYAFTFG